MRPEYQLALRFNGMPSGALLQKLDQRSGVTIERIHQASQTTPTYFMTVTVTGKAKLTALKDFIRKKLGPECTPIGQMQCADVDKIPPPIKRNTPA